MYKPRHTSFKLQTGMTVHIAPHAVKAHNNRVVEGFGRVGFNHCPVNNEHLYRVVEVIAGNAQLVSAATGRNVGWFNLFDLILIQSYKGFTIKGKINHRTYNPQTLWDLPWVAEIYFSNGLFMNALHSTWGVWASIHLAMIGINECLAQEETIARGLKIRRQREEDEAVSRHELEQDCDADGYADDPDWHELELWGREDY